jgi:lipid A 3-O-deacylase
MSLSILLLAAPTARAQTEALTWEGGSGGGVEVWRIGFQRPPREFAAIGGWDLTVAWELQAGRWRSRTNGRANDPVWEAGMTPVVRLERDVRDTWHAFVEVAVGAHLISRNKVHPKLDMSSAYQFGNHLGVGVRFRGVEIVFRHQHLSNASTVPPNHGVNFNMLRAVYYLH